MLNIVCILKIQPDNKKRPIYNKSWVDKLCRAVQRNYKRPFNFTCISNDLKDHECDYTVLPFVNEAWGWWNKLEVFRKGLFSGPTLYLDLDIVICKDISEFTDNLPDDRFLMPLEPYKDILSGGIIYFNGDYSFLYETFIADQETICKKFQYPTDTQPAIGDEAFYREQMPEITDNLDQYLSTGFFNWKHHKVKTPVNDPHILIFAGTQKPTNNLDMQLVKDHWI